MSRPTPTRRAVSFVVLVVALANTAAAQTTLPAPTRADILRGEYGQYRANNDLLSYHLDIRVDPAKQSIGGKNTIRFKMLKDDTRIQMDLYAYLKVDKILLGNTTLKYTRELNAVFIDFPQTLRAGREYAIDFYYSGTPEPVARFGCLTFKKDTAGRDWITTACEDVGASYWWPNKEQWRDEPESMQISVAVPNGLMDVSNGAFAGKTDLKDGYTRWDWAVHYPINNYDVALNIAAYEHFGDRLGVSDLALLAVDVGQVVRVAVHVFDEQTFQIGGPSLVNPHVGGVRGGHRVAEPLVRALVDDDEVEARADQHAGPVA